MSSVIRMWAAGGLAALALVAWAATGPAQAQEAKRERPRLTLADYEVHLKLGGDFTLTNQDGKPTNLKAYRGRVVLLFFGYTYCPDVCPLAMVQMGRVRRGLGKQAALVQPVFVSIDPERDTPARLKAYLASFEPGMVGLTGTPAEVSRASGLYRARYARTEGQSPANYLVDHTAYLYMVDGTGKLRYVFPPNVEDGVVAEGARLLLSR